MFQLKPGALDWGRVNDCKALIEYIIEEKERKIERIIISPAVKLKLLAKSYLNFQGKGREKQLTSKKIF